MMRISSLCPVAVTAALAAQQQPQQPQPMLLPQAVVLPRGDREIAIDGSLIDWPDLPALKLDDQRQLSGTGQGAWRGPDDLSALVFLMWDPQALYIAAAVRDEWHRALDAGTLRITEIPAADSILLTFDPDRDTRSNGPDPGRREDREFWLGDEAGRQVVQWDRLRGTARLLDQPDARVVVLHDKEHGITNYEARIPWSEILPPRRQPVIGMCIDLQVVVNDFDESTDPMPQTRIGWTFGQGPVIDPGLFGTIMLLGDRSPLAGIMPEFPPKPGTREPPAPPKQYWNDLTARLLAHPPARYDGSVTPEETGGVDRFRILTEIERHLERMPRIDVLELHQRIHRRMNREVAGLMARGLPWWWKQRLESVSKLASDPIPARSLRVFRLPMGGWLFRSAVENYMVDPAGNDLAEWLWGGAEFCVLTQPLAITRRDDQLLIRMFAAEPPRAVVTHLAFHLPLVPMSQIVPVEPGASYGSRSRTWLQALGITLPDGSVPADLGYRIEQKACPSVLIVGPSLRPEAVAPKPVDLVLLSPDNPRGPAIAARVQPTLVILDDALLAATDPARPRRTLADLHALQRALLPLPSVILAPGESWTLELPK